MAPSLTELPEFGVQISTNFLKHQTSVCGDDDDDGDDDAQQHSPEQQFRPT